MRLSRWIFGTLIVLTLLAMRQRASAPVLTPDIGQLAPLRTEWATDWLELGRAPLAEPVLGIAGYGNTVFVLQEHGWSLFSGRDRGGPFGGSEFPVGRRNQVPSSIAATKNRVYVLDGERRSISIWGADGTFISRRAYDTAPQQIRGVESLRADDSGTIFIVARPFPTPEGKTWRLLRLPAGDSVPTLLYPSPVSAATLGAMDALAVDTDRNGGAVVATAMDFKFHWLAANGTVVRESARPAAPFWKFSVSERDAYSSVLRNAPPAMRAAYRLSEYSPALRDVVRIAGGNVMVTTMTPDNGVLIELCDSLGRPLGRLNDRPLPQANIFVTRRGVFRVSYSGREPPLIEVRMLRAPFFVAEED